MPPWRSEGSLNHSLRLDSALQGTPVVCEKLPATCSSTKIHDNRTYRVPIHARHLPAGNHTATSMQPRSNQSCVTYTVVSLDLSLSWPARLNPAMVLNFKIPVKAVANQCRTRPCSASRCTSYPSPCIPSISFLVSVSETRYSLQNKKQRTRLLSLSLALRLGIRFEWPYV